MPQWASIPVQAACRDGVVARSERRDRTAADTLSVVARRTDPETVIRSQVVLEEHDGAPDGKRLALTLDVDPPRFIEGAQPRAGESVLARRMRRIDWRLDEVGYVDRWAHLHVVEARSGATPRQLTSGDWGVSGIAWAPDGKSIGYVADPRPDADLRPRTSIWSIDVDAAGRAASPSEPREVLA